MLAVLATVVGSGRPADATWAIVAVDRETGLVGAAMASCVPASVLGDPDRALVPIVLVPGQAAAVAQGTLEPTVPPRLAELLAAGGGASEVLEAILDEDDQPSVRQYALAVAETPDQGDPVREAVAAVTGDDVEPSAWTRIDPAAGQRGTERVAVAGALLVGDAVVDRAFDAYQAARAEGRSLDRALADALLVGSETGGDRRCGEQTALFGHLAVAEPDDDPERPSLLLTVTVDEGDGQNPVVLLDQFLDEGRTGWVDAGLIDPAGVPRTAVFAVGVALTVAAVLVLRKGMGRPAARR